MSIFGTERSPTFLGTFLGLNGQASADFWGTLPSEVSEHTISVGETIGQTAGAIVSPTAKAVSVPLIAGAVIAVGVLAFVYRKKLGF
jgi:hypothetical protein